MSDFLDLMESECEPPAANKKVKFDYTNQFEISAKFEELSDELKNNQLFNFAKLDDIQRGFIIYSILNTSVPIGKKKEFDNINIKKFHSYLKDGGFKLLFNDAPSTYHMGYGFFIRESDGIIVSFSNEFSGNGTDFQAMFYGAPDQMGKIEELFGALSKLKNRAKKSEIGFLVQSGNRLVVNKYPMSKVKGDIELNYNDDFGKAHDKIIEVINNKDSALMLLFGNPGTGKSFYLKSLINNSKKNFIYLGKDAVDIFCSPSFIGFALEELKDTILIIEDAETLLISNDGLRSGATVNILNLTDGILADIVKLKIIATFNCDIGELDKALLRKGRLKLKYEFKELSVEKSNKLLKYLNLDYTTTVPMLLTDIYNLKEENGGAQIRKRVGF